MVQIRVGTASWTDKTLIASGWYPPEADTPEKRLRFYARQFPLVEVDATYYALPAEQTATSWAERTPAGFTFNVKAFSLFTGHPTPVKALPTDLREAAGQSGKDRVYRTDVDPSVADQAWDRFLGALEPLRRAGKLGAILLQFPPWFPISRANKEYIVACAAPGRAGPGVRGVPQPDLDDPGQPGRDAGLPGRSPAALRVRRHAAGLPELDPAGAGRHQRPSRGPDARPLRQVGQQGHLRAVRLPLYRGGTGRLGGPGSAAWPATRRLTHVLFNNCYSNYAQVNAQYLADRLGT